MAVVWGCPQAPTAQDLRVTPSSDGQSANDTLNPASQRQSTSVYANAALPGLATTVTDPNANATSTGFDADGKKTSTTDPDGHTTTLTRDVMGRVHTSAAPGGQVTTDAYDPDGRLTGVSYSDGTHASGYGYDTAGRLVSMSDATGTSSYSHDVFGELTAATNGAGATTGYIYDGAGNTTAISYPGTAGTVTRGFNKVDQLTSVTDPAGATTGFGYDWDGDLTTTTAGNGTTVTVGYDGADQATTSTLAKGASTLGAITNTRDKDGDLTATIPSSGAPGAATGYTYTTDQRLASSTASGATTTDGYDPAGNPTMLGTSTQVFDAAGQLCWTTTAAVTSPTCGSPASGATTYSSNSNGQRTASTPASGTATGYTYNGAGQLTGVSGTATASYTYDGAGLRASKTVGGTTTVFTWDTAGSTPQLLSDGTTDYVYGPAGVPVEQFNASGAGNQQYYFADAHGSTVALTNSSGAVDATWTYSPWGQTTAHTGSASTPILFAGAYVDTETGLLYLQARYYDPKTALFLTVDALVDLTHQAYLYTGDDPLNRTDPTGLWSWGQVGRVAAIAGAVVGIAAISVATFGGADAFIGASAVTWGLALDTTATVLGAVSTGVDCASDFASVECALDSASMIFGIGGVFGDINDLGRGFSLEMGSLSETAAVGSLATSFGDDDDREDDEGSGSSEESSSTGGYGGSWSSGTGSSSTGGYSGYGNYSGSRWRGGSPC